MVTQENLRVIKIFLFPLLLIIGLFITVTYEEFAKPGFIALALCLMSLVVYYLPQFQEELLGLKLGKNLIIAVCIGAGISLFAWGLSQVNPALSIGMPFISLAIRDDLRFFFIVFMFPILEEIFFRSVMQGGLMEVYGLSPMKANIIQTIFFMFYHLYAYGVVLGAYALWVEAYGAFAAVSGLFIAAGTMGFIWGWAARHRKIENIALNIVSHIIINGILFTASVIYLVAIILI